MREPDFIIGTKEDPYLQRWYVVPRNPVFNVYLHKIIRSDDDRALHDHRSHNISFILKGNYQEVLTVKGGDPANVYDHYTVIRKQYQIIFRKAETPHRLIIDKDEPTWTLFIKGPDFRNWGFWCTSGWRPWEEFVSTKGNVSSIGRGCD